MLGARGRRIVAGDVFRRLVEARDFITDCYAAPMELPDLALRAGISPFHFLRLFSRAFDETPHAYLQRVRLERAKDSLARGAAVSDVCFEVGYRSLGSFSALFSRRFGIPPSAWQRGVRRQLSVPESYARLHIPCCFLGWNGLLAAREETQFSRSEPWRRGAQ